MDRREVASSNVRAVGYDEGTQTLEVEFHSGGVYQYYGVPVHVYREMMQAPSKGQFVNREIRNGYPYSRVE